MNWLASGLIYKPGKEVFSNEFFFENWMAWLVVLYLIVAAMGYLIWRLDR